MADLEVTLGAKNEASEVLKRFEQDFKATAQDVQFSIRGLSQLVGVTAVAVGLVESAKAIASFASSSVTAFDDTNRSAIRLSETLAIIPDAAGVSSDALAKMAQGLERVTNVDQSQIVNQMSAAARRGADPEQLDEMAEAAIGLARVFDRDLTAAMRLVEQATQGNFEEFMGLIPGIQELATEEEKLAAVSRLAQTGLENKANAARGALESSDALRVSMKQLYETVGALLAPIRDVVYKGLILISDFIVGTLNPDLEAFEDLTKRITDSVNGIAEAMLTGFIGAFTAAEVVILNFSDSVGVAFDYISLRALTMVEDIKYSVFSMIGQIQKIPSNLGTMTFVGVNEALSGLGITKRSEEMQEAINEANERLKKEFEIPLRQITETEKKLQESLNSRLGLLFDEYNAKFQERIESLTKDVKIPFKVELETRAKPQAKEGTQDLMRDLQAFESRVMTRGPSQSPVDRLAENAEKIAANTAEMLGEQKETNRILGVNVSPGDEKFVEIR